MQRTQGHVAPRSGGRAPGPGPRHAHPVTPLITLRPRKFELLREPNYSFYLYTRPARAEYKRSELSSNHAGILMYYTVVRC